MLVMFGNHEGVKSIADYVISTPDRLGATHAALQSGINVPNHLI
jgi:hypothetical protein